MKTTLRPLAPEAADIFQKVIQPNEQHADYIDKTVFPVNSASSDWQQVYPWQKHLIGYNRHRHIGLLFQAGFQAGQNHGLATGRLGNIQ